MQPDDDGFATAMSIGKQLCDALGVDSHNATRLDLIIDAGQPVKLVTTRIITQTQGLAVVQLLRQQFELVPRGAATVSDVSLDDSDDLLSPGAPVDRSLEERFRELCSRPFPRSAPVRRGWRQRLRAAFVALTA